MFLQKLKKKKKEKKKKKRKKILTNYFVDILFGRSGFVAHVTNQTRESQSLRIIIRMLDRRGLDFNYHKSHITRKPVFGVSDQKLRRKGRHYLYYLTIVSY